MITPIQANGAASPPARASRPSQAAFAMPTGTAQANAQPPAAAAPLGAMLSLQEGGHAAVRDRQARQRGQAMLRALATLQHAILAGTDDAAALESLACLAEAGPPAADPGLAAALGALALRARVELARRGL